MQEVCGMLILIPPAGLVLTEAGGKRSVGQHGACAACLPRALTTLADLRWPASGSGAARAA